MKNISNISQEEAAKLLLDEINNPKLNIRGNLKKQLTVLAMSKLKDEDLANISGGALVETKQISQTTTVSGDLTYDYSSKSVSTGSVGGDVIVDSTVDSYNTTTYNYNLADLAKSLADCSPKKQALLIQLVTILAPKT